MAGAKVRGITIDLGVDASGVASGLKSVNSSLNSTSRELKDIDRLLKLDPSNVTLLAQKHETLQRAIAQTRDKLDLLKKAEEQLQAEMKDGGTEEQQKQLAALQREIISTERDLDKYEKQLDETGDETKELTKAEQQAEQATGQMKEGFTVLKGALANLVADGIRKAVDGFKDLMTAAPAFADEILTLSSKTGLATDTLQELSYMSGLVDVDVSTVAGSLKKLTKNMDSARGGTGSAAEAFKTLGVSVTDINGNLRDNEDVFYDTIEALGKVENETERDAIAMNIFGKSATDLNPMIEAGSDALKGFAKEAQEMGYVLDKDSLESLSRVQDEFDRFGKQMEVVKNQIASGVAPAIERAMKKLSDVVKKIDWKKVGEQIGNAFNALIDALDWIVQNGAMVKAILSGVVAALAVQKVAQFVQVVQTMITALKAATIAQEGMNAAANANPYVLLATAIVACGAALISWQKSLADAAEAANYDLQATRQLIDSVEEHNAAIQENAEAYDELRETREASMNAGLAEVAHVQSLSDELKTLADANGVVADKDKARAQFILNELNNALGTEYTMTGNQISNYQQLAGSIDEVLRKKQAEVILSAQEEAYTAAIIGRQDAELKLAQATTDLINLENEQAEVYTRQQEILAEVSNGNTEHINELYDLATRYQELQTEIDTTNAAYQTAADQVDQYTYDVTAYTDNMTAALNGDYDQIQYKSWETAKAEGTATNQASKEVANNARNATNTWMGELGSMLSQTTGMNVEFKDAGNGMVQAYVNGQKYGQAAPANQVKAMGQQMHNQMTQIQRTMQTDGNYAAQGVGNGINSGSGYAYGAMSGFASTLVSRFKSIFKISSPSKVMAEMGGYMVEGVAQGIEKKEGIAVGAVETFADDLQSAFNPSLNGSYSAMVNGGGIASVGSGMTSEAGILNLLSRYLPELVNRDVTLDGDTLVGKLAPKYNKQFGRLETLNARGV
ncbi:MAG: hypothetical protein IIY21_00845 [Clostridiales bacterium]|nr:hypothetical protein [Clostridiales bacterium]MBQ1571438.1 hypothetical protein [Clostridiales bacterium]